MEFMIFGLQRSGTNYLTKLLKNNFEDARHTNVGQKVWKHSLDVFPQEKMRAANVILHIHKNPYMWVESIAFRNHVDWIARQTRYKATDLDQCGPDGVIGPKAMNPYNLARTYLEFHENWCLNPPPHVLNRLLTVRYEDLLDPEKRDDFLDHLSDKFDMRPQHDKWVNLDYGSVSQSADYDDCRERYYIEQRPIHLTAENIQLINKAITPEVIRSMGYEVL